ncbi:DUF378 domain-containing protein [Desulfosporosinus meridiei]|uniref:DUF378 domain-containing protein n=1 Tax=Desulfosporosinus meridiei TaxID=79209 RepID=UPI000A01CB34|nr:DUF378 domain-containing protein [Desulfosporosinus meridiei]
MWSTPAREPVCEEAAFAPTLRSSSGLSRIIYTLVGLAGVYSISFLFTNNKVR